jgi:hypothetical protein
MVEAADVKPIWTLFSNWTDLYRLKKEQDKRLGSDRFGHSIGFKCWAGLEAAFLLCGSEMN